MWPSVVSYCWLGVRKSIWFVKKNWAMRCWRGYLWSEVQTICIWSSWCHCQTVMSCLVPVPAYGIWATTTSIIITVFKVCCHPTVFDKWHSFLWIRHDAVPVTLSTLRKHRTKLKALTATEKKVAHWPHPPLQLASSELRYWYCADDKRENYQNCSVLCCVALSVPRDCQGRTSPKWPILRRLGRQTLARISRPPNGIMLSLFYPPSNCGGLVDCWFVRYWHQLAFVHMTVFASAALAGKDITCCHLSLCPSVTSQCSTETAKCRIMQTVPHNRPGTLVIWCWKSWQNSSGVTPNKGAKCRWSGLNAGAVAENWRLSARSIVNLVRSQVYRTDRPHYLFAASSLMQRQVIVVVIWWETRLLC